MTEELTVVISQASQRHLYTLAVLSKEFFSYAGISFDEVKRRVNSHNIRYLIAEINGKTVGFADYEISGTQCKFMGVAVLPEFQGKGIAKKLVQTIMGKAEEAGCDRVYLMVAEDNEPAISLYRASGFQNKGKSEKILNNKAILIMDKQLKPDRSYL